MSTSGREYETSSAQKALQLQALHEEVAAGWLQCQQQTEHVERQDVELSEAKDAMEKMKEESWMKRFRYGCFLPKIGGKPPNSSHFNRCFP